MDSESESEPEEIAPTEPSKTAVYNKEALVETLDDIAWPQNIDWIQKLTITHELPSSIDVNDDLARELAFYTQALDVTRQAFDKLRSMGQPFLRLPDYHAEMVKTDSHMLKIKGKLLVEKKKIEEVEGRKKAREAKKIAKEVQAQKNKERAKRKKEDIESVNKWRKQRQESGFEKGGYEELDNESKGKKRRAGVAPFDRTGGKQGGGRRGGMGKSKKRESKFGHGGRKGMKKQKNTADSMDEGGFSGNKRRKR